VGLVDAARRGAVRSVNAIMTATYWAIGRRIVEQEQRGAAKAGYGDELILRLSRDLQARFGRGFGRANLFQMRAFYLAYREIVQTASGESPVAEGPKKVQTPSGQSARRDDVAAVANHLPLPWSQYVRLLAVRNPEARRFYETEALAASNSPSTCQCRRDLSALFGIELDSSATKVAMPGTNGAGDPTPARAVKPKTRRTKSAKPADSAHASKAADAHARGTRRAQKKAAKRNRRVKSTGLGRKDAPAVVASSMVLSSE